MAKRVVISILLVGALLTAGATTFVWLIMTSPRPPERAAARPPLLVYALEMEPQTVVQPVEGYGSARADRAVLLTPEVGGEVVALAGNLRAGAAVTAGTVLVRIDDREYQALLRQARSQLAAAEASLAQLETEADNLRDLVAIAERELEITERELSRIRNLLERGQSSDRELDQMRLAYEQARRALQTLENQLQLLPERRAELRALRELRAAEVTRAELNLERTQLRAPFTGILDEVDVEIGQRVAPGSPLISLVDPDLIEVPVELPVSMRHAIHPGSRATLRLDSGPAQAWDGHVARVAPAADPLTRTFAAYLEVDNREQEVPLLPGMFVRAEVAGPTFDGALVVPRGAIQDGTVFVAESEWRLLTLRQHTVGFPLIHLARRQHAAPRRVVVRERLPGTSIVVGLAPGDLVITSNLDALYDGAPVVTRPAAAPDFALPPPAVADNPHTDDVRPALRTR